MNRLILLTGGSGGIGTSIAKGISDLEYPIINLDLKDRDFHFKNETFVQTDLSNPNFIHQLSNLSNVTDVVHCAGYGGPYHSITEVEEEEWDKVQNINCKSIYSIMKNILPYWKKRNFGRLVVIASSLSIVGSANSVAYSSAKHALIGFTKSIAAEWGEFGITSNAISPGYIETKMGIQEDQVSNHRKKILDMTPSKKIGSPEEIARVVLFLLSSDSSYINGANWTVDGGITSV
jgi:3-oxoacyl-[acyl-carrier protein] reductase